MDLVPQLAQPRSQVRNGQAVEIEETFIDTVDLDMRRGLGEQAHYPLGQIAIERIVGGQHRDIVAFDDGPHLEQRHAHGDAEPLRFRRAGDDAAVIVGEHDNRAAGQVRLEDALARDVEIVAIGEAERRHGLSARNDGGYCR